MPQCLGIDIGSTAIKGAVLDVDRKSLGSIARVPFPSPAAGLPAGWVEVDPEEVVGAARRTLELLALQAPESNRAFFCAQMGGLVLADASGRPLTRYLSWRDQRTLEPSSTGRLYLDVVRDRWAGGELRELGGELKPGSTAALLHWLAENGNLPAGAVPLTIGDFVLWRLCGSKPCTEPTQTIGSLNLLSGEWHHAAFEKLGVCGLEWPSVVPFSRPAGHLVVAGRKVACHPVVGDQQCALLGSLLAERELSVNVSTGSQVALLTPELRLGDYSTRHYFGGKYLNTITHLPAGRSLNVLVDLLTELAAA